MLCAQFREWLRTRALPARREDVNASRRRVQSIASDDQRVTKFDRATAKQVGGSSEARLIAQRPLLLIRPSPAADDRDAHT
jgi:hypothetical protein